MNLDDELLISLVRRYEELYDSHHKSYANHDKKEACWKQISKQMGATGKASVNAVSMLVCNGEIVIPIYFFSSCYYYQ